MIHQATQQALDSYKTTRASLSQQYYHGGFQVRYAHHCNMKRSHIDDMLALADQTATTMHAASQQWPCDEQALSAVDVHAQ
mgnify:CR=1